MGVDCFIDEIMDNFKIDIFGTGKETLAKALEIAFMHNAPGGKDTHYNIVKLDQVTNYYANKVKDPIHRNLDKDLDLFIHHSTDFQKDEKGQYTLILLWCEANYSLQLPYTMKIGEAIPFVGGLLMLEILESALILMVNWVMPGVSLQERGDMLVGILLRLLVYKLVMRCMESSK